MNELLYYISPDKHDAESLERILSQHPEIQFVSLMGIDLMGNATDEKIPISRFLEDINGFLAHGVQTDGSSLALHGIALLNDARIDLIPDMDVKWYVDYNFLNLEEQLPIGTLRIPAFLSHNGKRVDSRSILIASVKSFRTRLTELLRKYPYALKNSGINNVRDIEDIILTVGTELEFWVRTPDDKADIAQLHTSQALKEQYWKRTTGIVRTALEKTIGLLERYGLEPEMGHREVGGASSRINTKGKASYIMEQLEIDWKYAGALQAADNEIFVRELTGDVFRNHGLEAIFQAKPIEGAAGSGEHTHIGAAARLRDGSMRNLFAPPDMTRDYMSIIGCGALMGLLKNYEITAPFVTCNNNALNRLKPGFEAPVCIVASLGTSVTNPSRNRSVLVGLIRDMNNPEALRFEVRSPNPLSNTYLVLACLYQTMLDGIKAALEGRRDTGSLIAELSKQWNDEGIYLEKNRMYRSEEDVFEYYSSQGRNKLFSTPPETVWENVKKLDSNREKLEVLLVDNVFSKEIVKSFREIVISQWTTELENRIIPNNTAIVRECRKLHQNEDYTDLDIVNWQNIEEIRRSLMKDSLNQKCLFTKIKEALREKSYDRVSELQVEMNHKIRELRELYREYERNMLNGQ